MGDPGIHSDLQKHSELAGKEVQGMSMLRSCLSGFSPSLAVGTEEESRDFVWPFPFSVLRQDNEDNLQLSQVFPFMG